MNFASSTEYGESTGLPSNITSALGNQILPSGDAAAGPLCSKVPITVGPRLAENDYQSAQQSFESSSNVVHDSQFSGVSRKGPPAENLHLTESHKPNLETHMSTQHQPDPSTHNISHKSDHDHPNHSTTTSERRASQVANVVENATPEFSACGDSQNSTTAGTASSFFTSPGDSRLIPNTNEPSSVSDSYQCVFPLPTNSRSAQFCTTALAQLQQPSGQSSIDKPHVQTSLLTSELIARKAEACNAGEAAANDGGFSTSPTSNIGYKSSPTIGMLIKQESSPVTTSSPDISSKSLSSSVQTYQSSPVGRSLSNQSFGSSSQPCSESSNSTSTPTDVGTPSGSTKLIAQPGDVTLDRTVEMAHLIGPGEGKRSLKNSPETDKPIIQTLKSMALVSSLDGNSDIASTPVPSIIAMMTTILQTIIDANDSLSSRLTNAFLDPQNLGSSNKFASNVLAFHSRNIPTIGLEAYINRIQRYCPTTIDVFLSLLVYFDRIAQRVNQQPHVDPLTPSKQLFVVDSYSIHRLLIAGVTVSAKFSSDVFYQNSRYAKVGGLPVEELNYLELQFLLLLDFQLLIDLDEHQRYMDLLVEFCKKEETEPSQTGESATT